MGKYMMAADPLLDSVYLLLCRGMDVYNKHFCNKDGEIFHDEFYTKGEIVDAYSHYVATVVKRHAQETAILGTPISTIYCCGRTHFISRLGTRQRPTLFLGSFCVGQLLTSDHY